VVCRLDLATAEIRDADAETVAICIFRTGGATKSWIAPITILMGGVLWSLDLGGLGMRWTLAYKIPPRFLFYFTLFVERKRC